MTLVGAIFTGLMFLFFVAPWISILLSPFLGLAAAGSMAGGRSLRATQRTLARFRFYASTREILSRYFYALPHAIAVCSCAREVDGRKILSVQFKAPGVSWSHLVSGTTFEAVSARLQSKLKREAGSMPKCGEMNCCNLGHCPRRKCKQADKEFFRITTPVMV